MADQEGRYLALIATTASWAANDQVLEAGEPGFEVTTTLERRMKVGDGITAWSSLPYVIGWTQADLVTLILETVAELGSSAGAPGELVRFDANGMIDADVIPPELFDGTMQYKGGRNMRDNPPPTDPAPIDGDLYKNGNTGTFDAGWGPHLAGLPCVAHDFVIRVGGEWRLLSRGQLIDMGELELVNTDAGTPKLVGSASYEGDIGGGP